MPKKRHKKSFKRPKTRKKHAVREAVPLKQGLKPLLPTTRTDTPLSPRGSSTKTRIETVKPYHNRIFYNAVREAVPLKQGLKLEGVLKNGKTHKGPRGSSTKTRIETNVVAIRFLQKTFCPRGSSTKTRIETAFSHISILENLCPRGSSTKTRIETLTLKR